MITLWPILTYIAAVDFSHIRMEKLYCFTIDRLMAVLSGLGQEIEVTVDVNAHTRSAECAYRPADNPLPLIGNEMLQQQTEPPLTSYCVIIALAIA